MAKFLIRTINGENSLRYMRGDPVVVVPDTHVWGRYESLEVWIAEGRDSSLWPDEFSILELTGLSVEAGQAYLSEVSLAGATTPLMAQRRKYTVDIDSLFKLLPQTKQQEYNNTRRVSLNWANQAVRAAFKIKV